MNAASNCRLAWLLLLTLCLSSGCFCSPARWCYHDTIDDISDHKVCLDHLYRPGLDISRAGMPDWCQSRFNRRHAPCRCCDGYCRPPLAAYPAEYTLKYRAAQAEKAQQKSTPQPTPAANRPQLPEPQT